MDYNVASTDQLHYTPTTGDIILCFCIGFSFLVVLVVYIALEICSRYPPDNQERDITDFIDTEAATVREYRSGEQRGARHRIGSIAGAVICSIIGAIALEFFYLSLRGTTT